MIMSCKSPQELSRCLHGLQSWNKYHLTAAFSRLASFSRDGARSSEAASRLLPGLIARAKENLPRLQARSLATVAHCVGTFEHKDKDLMAELAKLSEEAFPQFTPQGLSNLLWSFARLDVQPSARWMDAYLRACQAALDGFKPQEMSIVMWSLAKLKFRMQSGKLQGFLDHVRRHLADYGPHSLSNVLWAVCTAEHRPESEWLDAVVGEMASPGKLSGATPQGLSQSLWALSMFRYQPSERVRGDVAARVSQLLPSCNAADLATFAYAYASLRMPADAAVLQRLQGATHVQMRTLLPSHLAKTVWAFAKLGETADQFHHIFH